MVEDGLTRTVEERGETRLRMMMRKMKANVMRNATNLLITYLKNYFIVCVH